MIPNSLRGTWIMAGVTFREAARKKILWTALIAGGGFLLIFGIGLHVQVGDFRASAVPPFLRYQIISAMLMVGLYTVDLLAVVMTTLTSVDTIAGEITSGTIYAIATKPLARWEILIGKWIGFAGMVAAYVALMFGGAIAEGYWIGGVLAQHPLRGVHAGLSGMHDRALGDVPFWHLVFHAHQWRGRSRPAGPGVPGRLAGTDERIHRGFAAGDGRDRVQPHHAERSGLEACGIRNGVSTGGVDPVLALRRRFRAEPCDDCLRGGLPASGPDRCHGTLSPTRSVDGRKPGQGPGGFYLAVAFDKA